MKAPIPPPPAPPKTYAAVWNLSTDYTSKAGIGIAVTIFSTMMIISMIPIVRVNGIMISSHGHIEIYVQ